MKTYLILQREFITLPRNKWRLKARQKRPPVATKLDDIPILVELEIRLQQHTLLFFLMQRRSIKTVEVKVHRAGLGTPDVRHDDVLCSRPEAKLETWVLREDRLAQVWGYGPRKFSRSGFCEKSEFGEIDVQAREVVFGGEGRIVGEDELVWAVVRVRSELRVTERGRGRGEATDRIFPAIGSSAPPGRIRSMVFMRSCMDCTSVSVYPHCWL